MYVVFKHVHGLDVCITILYAETKCYHNDICKTNAMWDKSNQRVKSIDLYRVRRSGSGRPGTEEFESPKQDEVELEDLKDIHREAWLDGELPQAQN